MQCTNNVTPLAILSLVPTQPPASSRIFFSLYVYIFFFGLNKIYEAGMRASTLSAMVGQFFLFIFVSFPFSQLPHRSRPSGTHTLSGVGREAGRGLSYMSRILKPERHAQIVKTAEGTKTTWNTTERNPHTYTHRHRRTCTYIHIQTHPSTSLPDWFKFDKDDIFSKALEAKENECFHKRTNQIHYK